MNFRAIGDILADVMADLECVERMENAGRSHDGAAPQSTEMAKPAPGFRAERQGGRRSPKLKLIVGGGAYHRRSSSGTSRSGAKMARSSDWDLLMSGRKCQK